jgi:hypothetical protein
MNARQLKLSNAGAHRGEPDRSKSLGDSGPRVWETFKARYEIFQPLAKGGLSAPAVWADSGPSECRPTGAVCQYK